MNGVAVSIAAMDSTEVLGSCAVRARTSVVMVVFMTGPAIEESLACVLRDPNVDELVIVDNGSTPDESRRQNELAAHDHRVVLIRGQGNVGFARAANLGARAATGEALIFLNPDAFLQPGCIAGLVAEIEGRICPSIVGGRVLNADRTEQRGARRGEITPLSALMSLSGLSRRPGGWRRFDIHWEAEALPAAPIAVPTISGACFCMRRCDFDAVNGFDENYFLHVEDVDLCWRVRRMGGDVMFHPLAEVVHLGHTSLVSPIRVEFHKGVGLARYFRKRAVGLGQMLVAWLLSPVVVIAAVARPVLWRLRERAG